MFCIHLIESLQHKPFTRRLLFLSFFKFLKWSYNNFINKSIIHEKPLAALKKWIVFDSTNQKPLCLLFFYARNATAFLRLRFKRANQAHALYARFALISELVWNLPPPLISVEKIPLKTLKFHWKIPLKS